MGFQKYITLAIITMFWVVLPYVSLFAGFESITKTSVQELTEIENPTVVNLAFIFVSWFAFYFNILVFQWSVTFIIIKLCLIAMLILTVLVYISVFRGD